MSSVNIYYTKNNIRKYSLPASDFELVSAQLSLNRFLRTGYDLINLGPMMSSYRNPSIDMRGKFGDWFTKDANIVPMKIQSLF